jgi:hypothetical protein
VYDVQSQNNNIFKAVFHLIFMPNADTDEDFGIDLNDDSIDDDPIPAKRDIRIFHRKKDDNHKNEEFDEDIFV